MNAAETKSFYDRLGRAGPECCTARELLQIHKGMNVSAQEFIAATDDVVGALQRNGVDTATQGEVTAILYSMKNQVIRV